MMISICFSYKLWVSFQQLQLNATNKKTSTPHKLYDHHHPHSQSQSVWIPSHIYVPDRLGASLALIAEAIKYEIIDINMSSRELLLACINAAGEYFIISKCANGLRRTSTQLSLQCVMLFSMSFTLRGDLCDDDYTTSKPSTIPDRTYRRHSRGFRAVWDDANLYI